MRLAFMCTDPGSCDGFVVVALLALAAAAALVVAFVWGIWYGVSHRLMRGAVSPLAAHATGFALGIAPPLLVASLARSGLFAFDPAIWVIVIGPFASLAFGLRTWSLTRRDRHHVTA